MMRAIRLRAAVLGLASLVAISASAAAEDAPAPADADVGVVELRVGFGRNRRFGCFEPRVESAGQDSKLFGLLG